KKNVKPLSVKEFDAAMKQGAQVLDTRHPETFKKGFVKGSLNIGLNGMYAVWVGTLIDINKPLILVCDVGTEEESVLRLARVGYENVTGYLEGGVEAWSKAGKATDTVNTIDYKPFTALLKKGRETV